MVLRNSRERLGFFFFCMREEARRALEMHGPDRIKQIHRELLKGADAVFFSDREDIKFLVHRHWANLTLTYLATRSLLRRPIWDRTPLAEMLTRAEENSRALSGLKRSVFQYPQSDKKTAPDGGHFLSLFSDTISGGSGRRGTRSAVPDQNHGQQQAHTGSNTTATSNTTKDCGRFSRATGQPAKRTGFLLLSSRQQALSRGQAHLATKLVALIHGQRACGSGKKGCCCGNSKKGFRELHRADLQYYFILRFIMGLGAVQQWTTLLGQKSLGC